MIIGIVKWTFFSFLKIQQNLQLGVNLSFLEDSLAIAKLIGVNLLTICFTPWNDFIFFKSKKKKKKGELLYLFNIICIIK
jgi:hypothetical protein